MEPINVLVRFSRLISTASSPLDVMPVLATAAVDHLKVDAAAVLTVEDDDLVLVASRGVPESLHGWRASSETIGDELALALAAAAGGFADARAIPLVSSVGLHGALVLLASTKIELDPARTQLAGALVDLAATASGKAADYQQLARSYAELRASRDALARTDKLRALGQMAAGVSHDLKNILNPLGLQLELLRRRVGRGDQEQIAQTIDQMSDVIRFGVDTVERLRDFSRQTPEAAAEPTDLAKVVASALEICRVRVGQVPALRLAHEPGAPPIVLARASELATAIVNLVINATDAMPDGGTITVRTGEEGGGGWVEVADDGPGMPPEVERHVFEPFFTTKGDQGTGLGLAMVYAFVHRHGGKLTLDTAPGRGTTFRLWFPMAR
ncbi:MAG TPA: HAMP domain-containing sensor histidine kinase [Kofleriaceae bacterium]|nr:HAMP domain-containing sensor histidine kinase [Kofleriaceae bacterium]